MALKNMSQKKKIKIVVTDSGLGGLFIMAALAERLRQEGQFQKAELIFFNCRPSEKAGYDNMRDNMERSVVFSEALRFMNNYYNPGVVLIACNTLSAIYGQTAFSSNAPLPVLGIIQDGVNEIFGYLRRRDGSNVIMFASPTTVESGLHKKLLVKKDVSPERLIYQECPGLPGLIDKNGPADRKVSNEIVRFMHEAVSKTQNRSFAAALLCTHFGLVAGTFARAAAEYKNFAGDIINPNSLMVEKFLGNFTKGAHKKTDVSISVGTMTEHSREMKKSLLPHIAKISPDTAQALRKTKYHADNEVFSDTVRAALKKYDETAKIPG